MDDHEGHDAKADDAERSLEELQERSGRLGAEIEGAGEDWERKQRDPAVPGAVEDSDDESDDSGEELDFGRDADYEPSGGDSPGDADEQRE